MRSERHPNRDRHSRNLPADPMPDTGRLLTEEQVNECSRTIAYHTTPGRPMSTKASDTIHDMVTHLMGHIVALSNAAKERA